jgi:hypothetical protein
MIGGWLGGVSLVPSYPFPSYQPPWMEICVSSVRYHCLVRTGTIRSLHNLPSFTNPSPPLRSHLRLVITPIVVLFIFTSTLTLVPTPSTRWHFHVPRTEPQFTWTKYNMNRSLDRHLVYFFHYDWTEIFGMLWEKMWMYKSVLCFQAYHC